MGFLLLDEPPPPFDFNYEDRDLLLTLGRHIAIHLSQYIANKKLNENQQFEAFNRLTAYMMHDLKNSAAQMSLLVSNAKKYRDNPDFIEDSIVTIGGVVKRIEKLIDQLRGGIDQSPTRKVMLNGVLSRMLKNLAIERPVPILVNEGGEVVISADPDRLVQVFSHLVKNAQEATNASGSIKITLSCHGNMAVVVIRDDGEGMDEQFIQEKLFMPFYSTKGSRGMGIGVYQAREYIRSLQGELKVESKMNIGTTVIVEIPLASFESAHDKL